MKAAHLPWSGRRGNLRPTTLRGRHRCAPGRRRGRLGRNDLRRCLLIYNPRLIRPRLRRRGLCIIHRRRLIAPLLRRRCLHVVSRRGLINTRLRRRRLNVIDRCRLIAPRLRHCHLRIDHRRRLIRRHRHLRSVKRRPLVGCLARIDDLPTRIENLTERPVAGADQNQSSNGRQQRFRATRRARGSKDTPHTDTLYFTSREHRVRRHDEYRRKPRLFGKFFAARRAHRHLDRLFIKIRFIFGKRCPSFG